MSTIPSSARELDGNSVGTGITIPTTVGEPRTPEGGPLRPPARGVMTKILLRGGHSTTIHGKTPSDLHDELEDARHELDKGGFYFLHHHEDYEAEPNGVAIDPRAVIGLIRIS
jgi:hypothetical protein